MPTDPLELVPKLLVSVRSAAEAAEALAGGASVIDLKEPARGPMGPTDVSVWRSVRGALPPETAISVALGELADWLEGRSPIPTPSPADWEGMTFRKIGLAGMTRRDDWKTRLDEFRRSFGPGPDWVVVAYTDHERAGSPDPADLIEACRGDGATSGILFDTWRKGESRLVDVGPRLGRWLDRAREAGLFVGLAGSLDAGTLPEVLPLRPDIVGVRGAACDRGRRDGTVDRERVAGLSRVLQLRSNAACSLV